MLPCHIGGEGAEERDALADEHRKLGDDELVDQVGTQEALDGLSAVDVLPLDDSGPKRKPLLHLFFCRIPVEFPARLKISTSSMAPFYVRGNPERNCTGEAPIVHVNDGL